MASTQEKSEPGENPLVPNARLREIHLAMLTARAVEDAIARKQRAAGRRSRFTSIQGQEAVRASVTLQLKNVDLISDNALAPGAIAMLQEDAASIVKTFSAGKQDKLSIPRHLPMVSPSDQRLQMALGAALALKSQGSQGVLTAYIDPKEVSPATLRRILKSAASHTLPIIFVALPSRPGSLSLAKIAGKCGIPGIPVDACDAVALYRVMQESLGRARGGDGAVFIECVRWPHGKRRGSSVVDPVEHIESFLLERRILTPAQLRSARTSALKRLRTR